MELKANIESLFIYPIKSLGHVELKSVIVNNSGLQLDREWMLTDLNGNFITQREFPILNLIQVKSISENGISLIYNNKETSFTWLSQFESAIKTKIWDSYCLGTKESNEISDYFSEILGTNVLLVRMVKDSRIKSNQMMPYKTKLNFVDGYPIHVINKESVTDLSNKIGYKVEPLQFRPNIIIADLPPFKEDYISKIYASEKEFYFAKKCVRCIMTTLKPNNSNFQKEPLKTLSKYRKNKNNIEFGIYIYTQEKETITLNLGLIKIQIADL